MKRTISWLLSLGLVCVLALGLMPNQAIAGERQLAQVEQPPKAALLAQVEGTLRSPVEQPAKEPLIEEAMPAPAATVSACSLCFSCGGSWPIYSGTIGKIAPASSYTPKERGSGCSGSLQYRSDTHPYLCCRAL